MPSDEAALEAFEGDAKAADLGRAFECCLDGIRLGARRRLQVLVVLLRSLEFGRVAAWLCARAIRRIRVGGAVRRAY